MAKRGEETSVVGFRAHLTIPYVLEPLEAKTLLSGQLVMDINPTTPGSDPENITNLNGEAYFFAYVPYQGNGLWKSDGTRDGTVLVKASYAFELSNGPMINVNGTLYFFSYNTLWKSDGTDSGTQRVSEISTLEDPTWNVSSATAVGGNLYFILTNDKDQSQLWTSDGSASGTTAIFTPSGATTEASIEGVTDVAGKAFFFVNYTPDDQGNLRCELWTSDGTETGTTVVKSFATLISAQSNQGRFVATTNGSFLFAGPDSQLWISDGTENGTAPIIPASESNTVRIFQFLSNLGGNAFFVSAQGDLWKTDGTALGTERLAQAIATYSFDSATVNNELLFSIDSSYGYRELWKTDGTVIGTLKVTDLPSDLWWGPQLFTTVGSELYFFDDATLPQIWKSDGTAAGTVMVRQLSEQPENWETWSFTAAGNHLFFAYDDVLHGSELWASDGTADGTELVKDISGMPLNDPSISNIVAVGSTVFFIADDGFHGAELWRSDGTAGGTAMVKDIFPGAHGGLYAYNKTGLVVLDGNIYFGADDGVHGYCLWKSDGTAEGTSIVTERGPGDLLNINGALFFSAFENGKMALWKSDGTDAGTELLQYIPDNFNEQYINSDGMLYFTGYSQDSGYELWRSDGTAKGTIRLKAFGRYDLQSYERPPSWLTGLNGLLIFIANDGGNGVRLWRSDGTPSGTFVLDVDSLGVYPLFIGTLHNDLYFLADGSKLWKTDGSRRGTAFVKSLPSYSFGYPPAIVVGDCLYFGGTTEWDGDEIWKTDGTAAGTERVKKVDTLNWLGTGGGLLYYVATNDLGKMWFWTSDGTEDGSVAVEEVDPPYLGSSFSNYFTNANGTMFYIGEDPYYGDELFKLSRSFPMPTAASSEPPELSIVSPQPQDIVSKDRPAIPTPVSFNDLPFNSAVELDVVADDVTPDAAFAAAPKFTSPFTVSASDNPGAPSQQEQTDPAQLPADGADPKQPDQIKKDQAPAPQTENAQPAQATRDRSWLEDLALPITATDTPRSSGQDSPAAEFAGVSLLLAAAAPRKQRRVLPAISV